MSVKPEVTHLVKALLVFSFTASQVTVAEGLTANSLEQYTAISEIYSDSLSGVYGALSVNQASGDNNSQSNSRAIAVTQDGGIAIAYTSDNQAFDSSQANIPDTAVSRISDHAFSGTTGLVSINQVSGANNRQLNAFAMATSINGELSDASLAETYTNVPNTGLDSTPASTTQRTVHLDSTAFTGASGIVQINQTSGLGNATSNRFEMSMGHPD